MGYFQHRYFPHGYFSPRYFDQQQAPAVIALTPVVFSLGTPALTGSQMSVVVPTPPVAAGGVGKRREAWKYKGPMAPVPGFIQLNPVIFSFRAPALTVINDVGIPDSDRHQARRRKEEELLLLLDEEWQEAA